MTPLEIETISRQIATLYLQRRGISAQPSASPNLQLTHGQNDVTSRIVSSLNLITKHKNIHLQDRVRALIPIDQLHAESHLMLQESTSKEKDFSFFLLNRLLNWFKTKFFTWVNSIPCDICKKDTENIGAGEPTAKERSFGGHRVELYRCKTCNAIFRFPRYNDPGILFETRRNFLDKYRRPMW
jgi:peptide-N4-(N-acetyl-beta-glucosaminyl)asparagine amidase